MKRRSDLTKFGVLVATLILASVCGAVFPGAALAAEWLDTAAAGDCAACHGEDKMLPEGHLSTLGMSLDQCRLCHTKATIDVTDQMPLSHAMQLGGVSCTDCHGTERPPVAPYMEKCLECHDAEEVARQTFRGEHETNPHNSPHYGTELDCTLCHFQHSRSEDFCAQCHEHGFVVPSPMVPGKKDKGVIDPEDNLRCTLCHSEAVYTEGFMASAHANNGCASCHAGIDDAALHILKEQKPVEISCGACHGEIAAEYEQSVHFLQEKLTCQACHTDIHTRKPLQEPDAALSISSCNQCHDESQDRVSLGHAARVMAGNTDAAGCTDCHGVHSTALFADTPEEKARQRLLMTDTCISCHEDPLLVGRNELSLVTVAGFRRTYHGKALDLGYPEQGAGCADCHLPHNILLSGDPRSPVHPDNRAALCGQCHEGFHPRFASFVAHPDEHDPRGFTLLFLTRIFMELLIASVMIFFWAHTILWWRKVYWEKSLQRKSGRARALVLPEETASQYVRRFSVRDQLLHLLLIISFMGVVISGFPLKYHEAPWADFFMRMLGGVAQAGLIHRISAALMWLLFLYTAWLSLKFLFPKGQGTRGWVHRLFGPDSLFPNLKDFRDVWQMFHWFVGKGEMPEFDRWTYWEKFDFFAVFWGMFVIGLSGLVLWLPEPVSYLLPGWLINVAYLAHSEEALLAAVFIFTVHFFNNHLVPNKFPMETNIFTGRYTLEALKEERPLEYERIMAEERLNQITCEGPGVGRQLYAAVVGLTSVLIGLGLTVLIFWAILA